MKNIKKMTYKELENEVIKNRISMRNVTSETKRVLINRNHDLMMEMNSRWN